MTPPPPPPVPRSRGPLARVLASWLAVSGGSWMFTVALGVFAYDIAGAGGTSAVTIARLLPAVLAAPFAGLTIDRVDRGTVVRAACLAQAAPAAAAGVLVLGGGRDIAALVATAVVSSVAGVPIRPALQAMLPGLARTPAELTRATAVWSAADSIGFLVGAGIGGLAIALTSVGTVLTAAAGLLLAPVLLATRLPSAVAIDAEDDDASDGVLAGLGTIRRTRLLHAPFALFVGLLVLEGTSDVQLVALALGDLHLGNGGPGVLYAVWGAGGLLGSGLLVVLVRRAGWGRTLFVASLGFAVAMACCGLGGVALVLVLMVPMGIGFSMVESAVMGIVPRLADDAVVGRVYAVTEVLYAGVTAIGAALAPLLIRVAGVRGSLAVVGGALAVLTLFTWRRCRQLDVGEHTAARIRELLHGIAFLAPLPLPRLERLVRDARPVAVRAGEDVVRAGEVGDEFYVVESGAVEVVEYGRRLVPGTGFGEIALVRDVPRTATVRAAQDTTLWAVSRPAFLAAVGASADVAGAVDTTIGEHLDRDRRAGGAQPERSAER